MARGSDSDKVLGPLEAEVMEALWAAGEPRSVREVVETVNARRREPLAYTTVMTVMNRLADKDVLRRERQGRGYIYEPTATDPAGIAVRSVIRQFGDAAMAHFVEEAKADPDVLRRLERLLGEEES